MSAGFTFETNIREVLTQTQQGVNVWGTPKADVGEGFCRECERPEPSHYDNCPLHVSLADFLASGAQIPWHLLPTPADDDGYDDVPYVEARWPDTDR
jgi:hypothetical protein